MEEGDIITVLEEAEGWWIGEIIDADGTKRSGMFPANYTEEIRSESPPPPKIPARRPKVADGKVSEFINDLSRQSSVEQEERDHEEQYEEEDEFDESPPAQAKSPPMSRNNSHAQSPTRQTSQRRSQTGASQRSGSPTGAIPPIPSRSSKPPPARNSTLTSSTSVPPRKAVRTSTNEYSSIGNSIPRTTSPPSSRNSYIPQDFIKEEATTQQDFGPCKECDCDEYSPNVFKKGSCKNCFHIH
jgi:hypothetical protein